MKLMSSAAKPLWMLFKILALTGRRRTTSMSDSVICPPSSTGSGSRLSSARFTLRMTLNHSTRRQPSSSLKQIAVNADDHHRAAELLHADFALVRKQRAERAENLAGAGLDLFQRARDGPASTLVSRLPGQDAEQRRGCSSADSGFTASSVRSNCSSPRLTVSVTGFDRGCCSWLPRQKRTATEL